MKSKRPSETGTRSVLYWRRLDTIGLERLELTVGTAGVFAKSTVLCHSNGGFRLDHSWQLDPSWRAQSVVVERWNGDGAGRLLLERSGNGWRVDGMPRPDLESAAEPDLSVTPFCNTLPIRRMGEAMTLDTAYIDGSTLTVTRSRQRYERSAAHRVRYIDLGVAAGFEAEIEVDEHGLVLRYESLFERIG